MSPAHLGIALHDWNGGGTERVAMALAGQWLAGGDRVTLLLGHDGGANGAPARAWAPEGLRIAKAEPAIPRSLLSRARLGPALARLAVRERIDAVLLPGNFHLVLARSFAAAGVRVVGKLSNPLWPYAHGAWAAAPLLRLWMAGADAYAAMNSGLAADTRALLSGARVETIEDPLLAPFADRPAPPHPDRFVMIGRLEAQKDTALGINAINHLRALRPGARLEIVGEGPQGAMLKEAATALAVPTRFLGRVSDVTSVLDGAAALLVTSRYEGGPAVAIEALARGVPVVSTDCSPLLRDVLTTPEAGAIVPGRDPAALAAALAAQTLRPDPFRLAVLRRFRPEISAARYRKLLLNL